MAGAFGRIAPARRTPAKRRLRRAAFFRKRRRRASAIRRIALAARAAIGLVRVVISTIRAVAVGTPLDMRAAIARRDPGRLVGNGTADDRSGTESRERIPPSVMMAPVTVTVIPVAAMSAPIARAISMTPSMAISRPAPAAPAMPAVPAAPIARPMAPALTDLSAMLYLLDIRACFDACRQQRRRAHRNGRCERNA